MENPMACHCNGGEPVPVSICPQKVKLLLGGVGSLLGVNYLYDVSYETWVKLLATGAIGGSTVWLNRYVQKEARLQKLPNTVPFAVAIITSMGALLAMYPIWVPFPDEVDSEHEG